MTRHENPGERRQRIVQAALDKAKAFGVGPGADSVPGIQVLDYVGQAEYALSKGSAIQVETALGFAGMALGWKKHHETGLCLPDAIIEARKELNDLLKAPTPANPVAWNEPPWHMEETA